MAVSISSCDRARAGIALSSHRFRSTMQGTVLAGQTARMV
jgi:hypothetical protein